jgi:hypothetical protein
MVLPGSDFYFWFASGLLALAVLFISYRFYKRKKESKAGKGAVLLTAVEVVKTQGPSWILDEIDRFRRGGEMSESFIRKLSNEERAFIEVALIDALTKWPREDQHRLRSMLIKHGYDEMCSRRLMKDAISERVRASTLLSLLRPQTRPAEADEPAREKSSLSATAARGGAVDTDARTRNE